MWVRGGDLITDLASNLGLDVGVQFKGDVVHQGVAYEQYVESAPRVIFKVVMPAVANS